MAQTSVRLLTVPVLLFGMLQLSGCTRESVPPPPPGGVYRSTSAGATFEQSVKRQDGAEGEHIADLALKRGERPLHAPDRIYVAAEAAGIVYSENGGETWQVITTPLTSTYDVVLLPNNVMVASGTNAAGQGIIIRSIDEGKSWEVTLTIPVPVAQGGIRLFGQSTTQQSVVVSLSSNPWVPDQVYAGTSLGTVLVGEQSAKTWRTLHTLKTGNFNNFNRTNAAIKEIIVSPHMAGEVLILLYDGALIRFDAQGEKNLVIPKNLASKTPHLNTVERKRVYDIRYVPTFPDVLFAGVDDGAVLSRDRGATWVQLPLPIDAAQRFNSAVVAVSPTNANRLLIAINTVVYRSEDGGKTWSTVSLELPTHGITAIFIDPRNAANVVLVTVPVRT